jgi:hypothetical protein
VVGGRGPGRTREGHIASRFSTEVEVHLILKGHPSVLNGDLKYRVSTSPATT